MSLLYVMEDGASAEIAVVGIALFMGGETTPTVVRKEISRLLPRRTAAAHTR